MGCILDGIGKPRERRAIQTAKCLQFIS
jgi:hypothetical protein